MEEQIWTYKRNWKVVNSIILAYLLKNSISCKTIFE